MPAAPNKAMMLTNESRRMAGLGRREEALAPVEEATGIYRQLADARPDTYLPHLAASLDNLADTLSSLNRAAEAAAIREQADAARSSYSPLKRRHSAGRTGLRGSSDVSPPPVPSEKLSRELKCQAAKLIFAVRPGG